jgi:hypothetical protein
VNVRTVMLPIVSVENQNEDTVERADRGHGESLARQPPFTCDSVDFLLRERVTAFSEVAAHGRALLVEPAWARKVRENRLGDGVPDATVVGTKPPSPRGPTAARWWASIPFQQHAPCQIQALDELGRLWTTTLWK